MKYDFISDPGHGWLKVKRSELRILGIDQQITPFSYLGRKRIERRFLYKT